MSSVTPAAEERKPLLQLSLTIPATTTSELIEFSQLKLYFMLIAMLNLLLTNKIDHSTILYVAYFPYRLEKVKGRLTLTKIIIVQYGCCDYFPYRLEIG